MTAVARIATQLEGFGLHAKIEGRRVWVNGKAFPYRHALKAWGFQFDEAKKKWYWELPEETESQMHRANRLRAERYERELTNPN